MHPLGHEVHPQPEQGLIFRTVVAGRVSFGGVFRRSLRATTKKRKKVVSFFDKKSAPPDKILATPMSSSCPVAGNYHSVENECSNRNVFSLRLKMLESVIS